MLHFYPPRVDYTLYSANRITLCILDVNFSYLKEVIHRYPNLDELLECLCIDLTDEAHELPKAGLVIANLLIEYIGYECFQKTIQHVDSTYGLMHHSN